MKRKYIILFAVILFIFTSCKNPSDNPEPTVTKDNVSANSVHSEEIGDEQESAAPLENAPVEPEIIVEKPYHVINDNSTVPDSIPEIIDGAYIYRSETIELTSLSSSVPPVKVKIGDEFLNLKIEELVNSFVSYTPDDGFYHGAYILFDGMVELKGKVSYTGSIMNGGTRFIISDKSYDVMPTFADVQEEQKDRYKKIDIFPNENMLNNILPDRIENTDKSSDKYIIYSEEITVVFENLELRIQYEGGAPAVFAEIVSIDGKVYDVE